MRRNSGFTLIEMVVSIGILAVFAAFMVAALNPIEQFKKASDGQRKNDLAQIQRGLEAYYQDYGRYPQASSNKIVHNSLALDWGSSWAPYMDILPKDPDASKTYVYATSANGQSYWLYASVDRGGTDPQACFADGSACTNVPSGVVCGGAEDICNFGVSSPNVSP